MSTQRPLVRSVLISSISFFVACIVAWRHELWIDESYHFLLAHNSGSIPAIVKNASRSGHPVLWNIILFIYGKFVPGIFGMQVLHCAFATACVFLVVQYSPFSQFEKICIAFGYYFIYEYNVIAKNYILGFFLIFLSLVLFEKKKPLILVAFVLGLAANTHLFTLFTAVFLFMYFATEYRKASIKSRLIPASLVLLLFCTLSVIQIIPPAEIIEQYNSYQATEPLSFTRFKKTFASLGKGLLNIPDLRSGNFWNSNLIYNLQHAFIYLASALLIIALTIHLNTNRKILFLFFASLGAIMMFIHVSPLATGVRYWGYYYVLLVIYTWCHRRQNVPTPFSKFFFVGILGIQLLVSFPVLALDFRLPFSNAKNMSECLRSNKVEQLPFFTESLALGPSLSAYSGKPVYYPSNKSFETFSYWIKHKHYSSAEFISESIANMNAMKLSRCVLIMNRPAPDSVLNKFGQRYGINKMCSFSNAIFPGENYSAYLLTILPPL